MFFKVLVETQAVQSNIRFFVSRLVVMKGPTIQDNKCVFRDEMAFICEMITSTMRSGHPRWGMSSLYLGACLGFRRANYYCYSYLFDNRSDVREVDFIFCCRQSVTSDYLIQLLLSAQNHLWVRRDKCEEPLNYSRGLKAHKEPQMALS